VQWQQGSQPTYTWQFTGGRNAVQIAASFDGYGNPIVYALNQNRTVSVFDQWNWSNLGGYALEISAGRSWGNGNPTQNIFCEIGGNHHVYVYNNSASSTWGTGFWQDLGGYATAISAEAIEGNSINDLFANDYYNDPYVYSSGWENLNGPRMHASFTPILW
jgi:hypothetical protein